MSFNKALAYIQSQRFVHTTNTRIALQSRSRMQSSCGECWGRWPDFASDTGNIIHHEIPPSSHQLIHWWLHPTAHGACALGCL